MRAWGLFENNGEWSRQCVGGCGHLLGSYHHPWHTGSEVCPGTVFHGPGPLPLLCALEAVNLGKHVCNFILQFLWTNVKGSAWRSGCPLGSLSAYGSGSSPSLLSLPHVLRLFTFKAGAQYLCALLCLHQPLSQRWESLCTRLTLFSACSLSHEVSPSLFPPTRPHSTWLAAPHRSMVLLFPVQNSSVALHGH